MKTYPAHEIDALLERLLVKAAAIAKLEALEAEDAHEELARFVATEIRMFRVGQAMGGRGTSEPPPETTAQSAAAFRWSTQRLSPGRQVHYFTQDEDMELDGPYAATVVAGDPETGLAELEVLFPERLHLGRGGIHSHMRMLGIPFAVEPQAGCWSWPART